MKALIESHLDSAMERLALCIPLLNDDAELRVIYAQIACLKSFKKDVGKNG